MNIAPCRWTLRLSSLRLTQGLSPSKAGQAFLTGLKTGFSGPAPFYRSLSKISRPSNRSIRNSIPSFR